MSESVNISEASCKEISNFGEKVFSYCLQKFGIIYKEFGHSPLFTEDIGNAVIILQLHIRDFLRDQLFRGVEKMVGVIDPNQGYLAIRQLLDLRWPQSLDSYDINTVVLGYLALITELIIFLDSLGLPIPRHWFKEIWTLIFVQRLYLKFSGGWEGLKEEARRVYVECPNKEELFDELKLLEHPYAEVHPLIETSFKELDPFFMFCSLGTGFDIPIKPGLSSEAQERLLQDPDLSIIAKSKALPS